MNDQIILNKKEAIIQMQQKLDGKVKGIVTDHKGEPIACVNVVEKGTRNGTITPSPLGTRPAEIGKS